MKRAVWILLAALFAAQTAFADVYVKAAAMNGMGVTESRYSGKKKADITRVDAMGMQTTQINITRVDKNLEWELDTDLKMYHEKPISLPDTPGDSVPAEMKAAPNEKWIDLPQEEKDICEPQLVTLPQKQTIAGYEATGYQAVCPLREKEGAPRMTMWMAPASGALAQYDREVKEYEKEYRKVQFKKMTAAERKLTEEMFSAFGQAAGGLLLGLRIDKIPRGVPLKMEQDGVEQPDGSKGKAVMYELLEVRAEKADPSIFEIPAGYTKVTDENEYAQKKAQLMADKMGMGDMYRSQMAANEAYAKMLPPESAAPEPETPAVVTETVTEPHAPAAHVPIPPPPQVQEDTTNEDFDARDYVS